MVKKIITLTAILFYCINSNTIAKYNRKIFTGSTSWIDVDFDCQNTRAEVLIRDNLDIDYLKFSSAKKCLVDSGLWFDNYTGIVIRDASNIDIDHMVSLKDAWISGANKWDKEKLSEYSNVIDDSDHLIPVYKLSNRAKGSKGPDEWLPGNKKFVKEYCRKYIRVKLKWDLTITEDQLKVFQNIFGDEQILYPEVRK